MTLGRKGEREGEKRVVKWRGGGIVTVFGDRIGVIRDDCDYEAVRNDGELII